MNAKEATSKLNKFRNNHYNDIDEEKREIAQTLNVVLPQLEQLKRDVKRYFETTDMVEWSELGTKLSKVGNGE